VLGRLIEKNCLSPKYCFIFLLLKPWMQIRPGVDTAWILSGFSIAWIRFGFNNAWIRSGFSKSRSGFREKHLVPYPESVGTNQNHLTAVASSCMQVLQNYTCSCNLVHLRTVAAQGACLSYLFNSNINTRIQILIESDE
jgi:hypothetical protein